MQGYDLKEHRHRYAAWCAARAVARGVTGAKYQEIEPVLQKSGVRAFVESGKTNWPKNQASFDTEHARLCKAVQRELKRSKVENTSYGLAAKIVAVYLKTLVVVGGRGKSTMSEFVHPPIDRIMLKAYKKRLPRVAWDEPKAEVPAWTKLDQRRYNAILDTLKGIAGEKGLWTLEEAWLS